MAKSHQRPDQSIQRSAWYLETKLSKAPPVGAVRPRGCYLALDHGVVAMLNVEHGVPESFFTR